MRRFKKIFLALAGVTAMFILAEAVYFTWALQKKCVLRPVDAIVVFNGAMHRVKAGYALAYKDLSPILIISPASKEALEKYDQKYERGRRIRHVLEANARSTFENALFIRRIEEREKFHSVLLVASFEHFPRSYFLLRVMLCGLGTKACGYKVRSRCGDNGRFDLSGECLKRYFNEMVRFWGSLVEMAIYAMNGRLPKNTLKKAPVVIFLRKHLLFKVGWD